jgi:hypothetical protein
VKKSTDCAVSSPHWLPQELVNERQYGFIEGYAAACEDIRRELTGDGGSGKSYDPMHIVDGVMHSYAFNMKDGGRRHPLSDYAELHDVLKCLLAEALEWIREQ